MNPPANDPGDGFRPRPIVQIATKRRTIARLPWELDQVDDVANDPVPPRAVIALDVPTHLQLHDCALSLNVNPSELACALLSRSLSRLLRQHADRLHPFVPPVPDFDPRPCVMNHKTP